MKRFYLTKKAQLEDQEREERAKSLRGETLKETKERERRELRERRESLDRLNALTKVYLFPGSIDEYERFRGYKAGSVIVLDTASQNKGVRLRTGVPKYAEPYAGFWAGVYSPPKEPPKLLHRINNDDTDLEERLLREGMEAIVNASPVRWEGDLCYAYYGLPVAKKKQEDPK
ncbi:MAG: hypothetical protein AABX70_06525 [Nanoarchaeota archaeon]